MKRIVLAFVFFLAASLIFLGFFGDRLLNRLLCYSGHPTSVDDMNWEKNDGWNRLFRINGREKEQVFNAAIEQLQNRNFTVCSEYLYPEGANNALPCAGACGTPTSLKRGIIIAEKVGLARRSDGRVLYWGVEIILGFREEDGATLISLTRREGSRYAWPEWDGDLSLVTDVDPSGKVTAIVVDLYRNLGRDIEQALN